MISTRARRSIVSTFALLAALASSAFAADFTVPPTPTHFVTDEAGALNDKTTAALEAELKAFEKATGHQVIVYVGDTTGAVPLETFTAETAHTWHIGRKGKDDGAILFLFMSDHKVRIEVGYGLEGSLTDAAASAIIEQQIVPRMHQDDPNGAVTNGVASMLGEIDPSFTLTATPAPEPPHGSEADGDRIGTILGFVIFGIFWVGVIVMIVVIVNGIRNKIHDVITHKGSSGTHTPFWSSGGAGIASSVSSDDNSSSDDFSSGGGDFGGGGASGSW
jgi:uncharacterized protein